MTGSLNGELGQGSGESALRASCTCGGNSFWWPRFPPVRWTTTWLHGGGRRPSNPDPPLARAGGQEGSRTRSKPQFMPTRCPRLPSAPRAWAGPGWGPVSVLGPELWEAGGGPAGGHHVLAALLGALCDLKSCFLQQSCAPSGRQPALHLQGPLPSTFRAACPASSCGAWSWGGWLAEPHPALHPGALSLASASFLSPQASSCITVGVAHRTAPSCWGPRGETPGMAPCPPSAAVAGRPRP